MSQIKLIETKKTSLLLRDIMKCCGYLAHVVCGHKLCGEGIECMIFALDKEYYFEILWKPINSKSGFAIIHCLVEEAGNILERMIKSKHGINEDILLDILDKAIHKCTS